MSEVAALVETVLLALARRLRTIEVQEAIPLDGQEAAWIVSVKGRFCN